MAYEDFLSPAGKLLQLASDIKGMQDALSTIATNPLFFGQTTTDGALLENHVEVGADNTLYLDRGNLFTKTVTEPIILSVLNPPPAGRVIGFILDIANGGAFSVGWWPNIAWPNGEPPALTVAGRDALGFYTYDGGATWTGFIGKDVKNGSY